MKRKVLPDQLARPQTRPRQPTGIMKMAILLLLAIVIGRASTAGAGGPGWQVSPPDFELAASMTAQVLIDDMPLADPASLVAVFVGDEVRGVSGPIEALGQFVYFITTYANAPGDTLRFRLYVADRDTVLDLDETLVFEANAVVGAPDQPFVLHGSLPTITAVTGTNDPQAAGVTVGLAFPNPFNCDTVLPWHATRPGRLEIVIYDLLGRPVRHLHAGWRPAGPGRLAWNGQDDNGLPAASGAYHVVVTAFGSRRVQRVALIR